MLLLDYISEICQCLWRVQPHVSWHLLKNARHSCELFGRQWQTHLAKQCPEESISRGDRPVWPGIASAGAASAHVLLEGWMALGLSSLLGFPSGTCGTKCLQAASRWPWGSFLHGFQKFESKKERLFWGFFWQLMSCLVSTIPWRFLAKSLLSFLDNLCVAKMCCRAQQHSIIQGCGQPLKQHRLAPDSAVWSRLNPCTSYCWVQVFALVTRVDFSEPEEQECSGTSWVWIWAAEEKVTPATFLLKLLCSAFPIQYKRGNWQ